VGDLKAMRSGRAAVGEWIPGEQCDDNAAHSQKEKLLALALEASNDGIWVWHIPTGEAYFSPRYYTMLGYEPDEFPAGYDTWASLLHPDDLAQTRATIQQHIENRSAGYEVEFRLKTKAGDWLWILGHGKVAEWDEDGKPLRLVGSHVNIDNRKRVEQQLAAYRDRLEKMVQERTRQLEQTTSLLEATFNAIPDVLGVQDNQHHIIRYNAAGYQFLDRRHEEVEGKRCFELIGRQKECDLCATSECYRTKKPASVERYEEALGTWLDVRAYPILDDMGNIVKVIEHLRDITPTKTAEAENRKLQTQLLNAQKMESLGTLAGGIAHDFNNLLMGIQGRISLIAIDMEPYHIHTEHISAIEEYIRSATNLTKQLLGFARGGKYEVNPIDINQLLTDSAAMFGRTRKELQIHTQTALGALTVEADKRQIEQVLLNTYINAWQAMPDGGELYLATSSEVLDEAFCKPHQVTPGRYAKMSVTDTGVGMDEATRLRIFDPFFTTKDKARGTGLGLASAYGIVKNHSGFITVYSEVAQGTTLNIYLPLSDKVATAEAPAEQQILEGSETVLLVDDEEMIVDVCKAMLEKLGYRVVVANGGAQAIDLIQQKGADIDLVILDLIMPGMDGGAVFERIRDIMPAMPVILSSGYAINGQATQIMQNGCNGFIQKPFNFYTLSEKIRKTLDAVKNNPQD
jgi:two-component system, cell cycle sensor histidine kinase and response regulator CckA